MDLPGQLFPQSTAVLLSPCKQDEGNGRGKAHVKGGIPPAGCQPVVQPLSTATGKILTADGPAMGE